MSDAFWIQAGSPRHNHERDADDENVSEAMETVYPLKTECMLMVWAGVYIPLSYKYDLSVMLDDVIRIINQLMSKDRGQLSVAWPSNTFRANWNIAWDSDRVEISSQWEDVVGGMQDTLNQHSRVSLDKMEFISEWKRPLECILLALRECGYSEDHLKGMRDLALTVDRIPQSGILYD